jgi:hypothetical protein
MSETFAALDAELNRWRDGGLTLRLWLRDDDATQPTEALDRLLACIRRYDAPLLLAVIPEPCDAALADRLADETLVIPAVHGFAHTNHAPAGAKPTELTEHAPTRTVDTVLAEVKAGRRKLRSLFGERLSGILVPPWNRISPAVLARLDESGFAAVSLFGWKSVDAALPQLNTHVDLIDWRNGRLGRDLSTVGAMLTEALAEARHRGGAPVGLLTHHLAHDETAWSVLETVLARLSAHSIPFASAEACLAAQA